MPALPVFTPVKGVRGIHGTIRDEFFDLTFITDGVNSNYTVGGIAIDRRGTPFVNIESVAPIGHATLSGAATTDLFVLSWDYKSKKIQLFADAVGGSGLSELGAVDISAITFRVRVIGT